MSHRNSIDLTAEIIVTCLHQVGMLCMGIGMQVAIGHFNFPLRSNPGPKLNQSSNKGSSDTIPMHTIGKEGKKDDSHFALFRFSPKQQIRRPNPVMGYSPAQIRRQVKSEEGFN
mmetsp:Transcript_26572/g.42716  ORF Transcript_26572/g.42716 Transcript_26572/m.42716 type:complete len:114 (+) Transcript_26572:33-374(+)